MLPLSAGSPTTITGVTRLRRAPIGTYRCATWDVTAPVTRGDISVMGTEIARAQPSPNRVTVRPKAVNVATLHVPRLPTDLQPMAIALSIAAASSVWRSTARALVGSLREPLGTTVGVVFGHPGPACSYDAEDHDDPIAISRSVEERLHEVCC